MGRFRLLVIKVTITSLFFTIFQPNFSNADTNLCKIENNKLWTKLDHGLGFPRPENKLPNKGTLNFKVLFAKSSGSTVANENQKSYQVFTIRYLMVLLRRFNLSLITPG